MNKNTITYIIIAIVVVLGAYWAYTKLSAGGASEGGVAVLSAGNTPIAPVDEVTSQANQFIQILQNVDQVSLSDLSLLSNPIFQNKLQDFGREVPDRQIGRVNPFAPVTGIEFVPVKPVATTTSSGTVTPMAKPAVNPVVKPTVKPVTKTVTPEVPPMTVPDAGGDNPFFQ